MQKIEITFDDAGNPLVEVKGVQGQGCKALTAALESDLGSVRESKPTAEFYQKSVEHRKQNNA